MPEPTLRLLDARERKLDEEGLRTLAREESAIASHSSRSYRFPYAIVACHGQSVGVDIERIEHHDRAFAESICTPSEVRELDRVEDLSAFASSLWCSKEALAKALGDALQYDPRRLESPIWWRDGSSGVWRAKQLDPPAGHVAWLCWRD